MSAQTQPSPTAGTEDPWLALGRAQSDAAWLDAWLQVLLLGLLRARAGVLLLAQDDGSYAPEASWPPGRDVQYLADIATEALRERQTVVRHDTLGHARVALPLLQVEGEAATVLGAVVADLGAARHATPEQALHWMHWGVGWLLQRQSLHAQAQAREAADAGRNDGEFVLHTLLGLMAEPRAQTAEFALVNALAARLGCSQVWLALVPPRARSLKLAALSGNAEFQAESQESLSALQALHEAFDQRSLIAWAQAEPADPAAAPAAQPVHVAHERHARSSQAQALISLPLADGPTQRGALLLERQAPFGAAEQRLLQALAAALGPWLALRQQAAEGVAARMGRRWRTAASTLAGNRHPALKLGVGAAALLLLLLALWPATLRVSAKAVVEGAVQRAVVAPFEGYLRYAAVRAGDAVKSGQVMAELDDKDLRLERTRWEADLEVAQRKEREAMAAAHRVNQRLAAAQANQARAQLDLVAGRLQRAQVLAPFDGTVVKGDLSQQLGSPLEQGKVLFEVAPLDAWRVVLLVDERDIGLVQVGAAGELRLQSVPGRSLPFTVRRVMPTASAEDGRNLFRVEAALAPEAPRLSPNMEGAAKIDAGESTVLWQWLRPLAQWLQVSAWKLMP